MTEPKYLTLARTHIGLRELTGQNDHPLLLSWWAKFNAKWLYRQAWCGLFVAHCLNAFGHTIPATFYRAKSFLDWGVRIDYPCLGCVVIFDRKGGGHVGFVVGKDNAGRLLVLGGNQGNKVSIEPFDVTRVMGYRVPPYFTADIKALPILSNLSDRSTNEA